ncbi:phage tail family protein, partial [Oceanobacillus caeni]
EKGDTFLIYNAGNVGIHPFEQELRIDISNVYRSTNFFELNNLTNGSTFRITEQVSIADAITIDGANIWINNLEALRRTNRKYIQLDPGWNVFSIDGADSAEIKFSFRFYYL